MKRWTTRRRALTVAAALLLTAGAAVGARSRAVGASPGQKGLRVVVLDPAPGNDGFVDFGDVDPKGAFDPVNGVFDVSAGDTIVEDLPVADADGNGAGRAYTTVTLVRNLPPGDLL